VWKNHLLDLLRPRPGMHLLDVAGGTGDIALRFLERAKAMTPGAQVTVLDQNPAMLEKGRRKAFDQGITQGLTWVCGDVLALPFSDDTFDVVTISFGLRNVMDLPLALQEMRRVLKPGGMFFCLEFSKVQNPLFKKAYEAYSFGVIPTLGRLLAADGDSYQYLVESIARFPDQETLRGFMVEAGFQAVSVENLMDGLVAIHGGQKN
jgi:demethylmenaquinone methyltransferase/2-methoxy-6-polyprenyl-1,4-benzoquinol methylase